jgi:hypothetical protein
MPDYPEEPERHAEIRKCIRAIEADLAYIHNLTAISQSVPLPPGTVDTRQAHSWSRIRAALFLALAHTEAGQFGE